MSEALKAIHQQALIEFDRIEEAVYEERLQCLQDRRFYSISGAQWEGPLGEQFANKPRFEVNKIHLSVIRIFNEYRNNRITVDFQSKSGLESDSFADNCDGLYRADEDYSEAEEAYDNAFEEAVGGGFGAWRLRAKYEDEEDEEDERQRICIEPIYDADASVFFDLNAKRQDKSDAKHCFVLTSMTHAEYEDKYDEDISSWDKSIHQCEFDWSSPDIVYIAEYYKVEEVRRKIFVYEHIDGTEERYREEDLTSEVTEKLRSIGSRNVRKKKIRTQKVHKYILSGSGVKEDCGYIAGKYIPIIPVYGKRWFVDNVERCMGHVRLAKDMQRVKNMQISKLGEISALSSVEKPLLSPEQIAGHQVMWQEDNIKNYPYLLINPITDQNGNEVASGPIGYTKPPTIPQALSELLRITEEDIQDLLGNQDQSEQIVGNVAEGTVELFQNRLDMQTFIYMSNMAKAIKRGGEVWLSMAADVYVEEGRAMKTLGLQGETGYVNILNPVLNKAGKVEYENDFSQAKMDVSVEVGPSSSTRRAATVRALTKMAGVTDDPETKQVLGAMTMMNMEGEGISDVRAYFRRKLLKMGVIKPSKEEAQELIDEANNTPLTPQDEYLRSAAIAELSKADKDKAQTLNEQAKTDKTRAETAEILTEIDVKEGRQAMEVIEKLGPRIEPDLTEPENNPG